MKINASRYPILIKLGSSILKPCLNYKFENGVLKYIINFLKMYNLNDLFYFLELK
jgi:hypothetical protein